MGKNYKNLGGWLLFWLIYFCLTIVLAFTNLLTLLGESDALELVSRLFPNSIVKLIFYMRIGVMVLVLASFVLIVFLMLKKTKKALANIKLALIVGTIMDIVSAVIYVAYLGSLAKRNYFGTDQMINLVVTIGVVTIALAYFSSSKRVAVYFDENYVEPVETLEVNID
jgi:Protein of unknown function (DUF2569).